MKKFFAIVFFALAGCSQTTEPSVINNSTDTTFVTAKLSLLRSTWNAEYFNSQDYVSGRFDSTVSQTVIGLNLLDTTANTLKLIDGPNTYAMKLIVFPGRSFAVHDTGTATGWNAGFDRVFIGTFTDRNHWTGRCEWHQGGRKTREHEIRASRRN